MLLKLGMGSGGTRTGKGKMKHAKNQRIGNKVIRELKQRRRRRHKNGKEQQIGGTTTLHVHHAFFFHISLPSSHDYDMKLPNFTLCGGREHMTTTLFSFSEL